MLEIIFFGTALVLTVAGVAVFRRYGSAIGTFDIPNERSSHTSPTLRGGGLVIVVVCLALYVGSSAAVGARTDWAFVAGAVIVAAVSWIDDAVSLPAIVRFIAHSAAAVILIAGSGALTGIHVPAFGPVAFGPLLSSAVTFFWIVWMINAYNFMDGIDGIAGAEGVVAGIGWAAMGIWLGDKGLYIFAGVLAFSCLGFLFHNWHPARVFMGDVGSAFLGYTLAAVPLIANADQEKTQFLFTAAISFVWLFLFDTVFTFVRRLVKKEKVWLAHRNHIYQRLVIRGWGHATVTALYTGLSMFVAGASLTAFVVAGNATPLALFSYAVAPTLVAFPAFRKKV